MLHLSRLISHVYQIPLFAQAEKINGLQDQSQRLFSPQIICSTPFVQSRRFALLQPSTRRFETDPLNLFLLRRWALNVPPTPPLRVSASPVNILFIL